MSSQKNKIIKIVLSAMFLALAMVLPFVTGQIPQIGKSLLPMHIPVMLCGFFVGPLEGALIGIIAPLLRFALFGMPRIMPDGIVMCVELFGYGLASGLLYRKLAKTKLNIYVSLIGAMLVGRILWGIIKTILFGLGKVEFGFALFIAGGFLNAIPGIILQIVLIPILVMLFSKYIQE